MPVKWNLREVLRQRGITRASQTSRIIYDRTGYKISTQAVCDLLKAEPKMLRLDTAQALCDALGLQLRDFLEIVPGPLRRLQLKQSHNSGPINLTGSDSDEQQTQGGSLSPTEAVLDVSSFFFAAAEIYSSNTGNDQLT